MNNTDRHPECHMRTALGNCDPIGGFCTSVNEPICEALHKISRPQGEWTLCSEKSPEVCQNVQLTCEVRPVDKESSRYICIAEWIPRFCQEALSVNWDAEATEYCEEDDEYYPLEGWYECIRNWDDYSLVGIADFAIAWKPLEEPYKGVEE